MNHTNENAYDNIENEFDLEHYLNLDDKESDRGLDKISMPRNTWSNYYLDESDSMSNSIPKTKRASNTMNSPTTILEENIHNRIMDLFNHNTENSSEIIENEFNLEAQ